MKALASILLLVILGACGSTAQAHARPFWDGRGVWTSIQEMNHG